MRLRSSTLGIVALAPSGTNGFTSLFLVDVTGAELTALRARMQSPLHDMLVPAKTQRPFLQTQAIASSRSSGLANTGPKAAACARTSGLLVLEKKAIGRAP